MRGYMSLLRHRVAWRDGLLIGLSGGVMLLYLLTAGGGFPLDDSWIHQVYARNLADYGEWSFIQGQPSAASTAPLYTLLLSIGYWLDLPYPLWTHVLGGLALALTAMMGARLADWLSEGRARVALLTGCALVLAWHLAWAAAAGMETILFCLWTLGLIARTWHELYYDYANVSGWIVIRRGVVFGAMGALAMLIRPEGVLLAGLGGAAVILVRPQTGWHRAGLWMSAAAAGFAVCIAPYLALNLSLTGGLLPATAAAKYAQHLPILQGVSYPGRLLMMTVPIIAGGQVLLLPGVVVFIVDTLRKARRDRRAWVRLLPLVWSAGLIALYAAQLPAAYQHGRYVIPALPALLVAGVVGTAQLVRQSRRTASSRVLASSLALAAGIVFVYFGVVLGPGIYRQDVRVIEEEMVASAQWIAEALTESDLLAVHDIGAVGYFAPRPILDIAGLISPEIGAIYDTDAVWDLMRERGVRYLMAFPDQIPGAAVSDPRLCPVYESDGQTAVRLGGGKMRVYALAWDGVCRPREARP